MFNVVVFLQNKQVPVITYVMVQGSSNRNVPLSWRLKAEGFRTTEQVQVCVLLLHIKKSNKRGQLCVIHVVCWLSNGQWDEFSRFDSITKLPEQIIRRGSIRLAPVEFGYWNRVCDLLWLLFHLFVFLQNSTPALHSCVLSLARQQKRAFCVCLRPRQS